MIVYLRGRDVCDGPLVDFPGLVWFLFTLHQSQVVEPRVIVVWVGLHLLSDTTPTCVGRSFDT